MSQDLDRVAELAALCKRQRQGKKPPRYSEDVKSLVRELVASGIEKEALARATGVSSNAIRNWADDSAEPKPLRRRPVKILNVEGDAPAPEPTRLASGGAVEHGRMVMMIRVSEFDVAIYSRDGGRS